MFESRQDDQSRTERKSANVPPIFAIDGLTADVVAGAHQADIETQEKYGVKYLRCWFDEATDKVSA